MAAADRYSSALSVGRTRSECPVFSLIVFRIFSRRCEVYTRVGKKSVMRSRVLVSSTVMTYLLPWRDVGVRSLHISLLKEKPLGYVCRVDLWGRSLFFACAQVGHVILGDCLARERGRLGRRPISATVCIVAGRTWLRIMC